MLRHNLSTVEFENSPSSHSSLNSFFYGLGGGETSGSYSSTDSFSPVPSSFYLLTSSCEDSPSRSVETCPNCSFKFRVRGGKKKFCSKGKYSRFFVFLLVMLILLIDCETSYGLFQKSPRHRVQQEKQQQRQPEDDHQTILDTKRAIFEFQQELEEKERLEKQQEQQQQQQQQQQRGRNNLTPILLPEHTAFSISPSSSEVKSNDSSFDSPAIMQRKAIMNQATQNNNNHNDLRRFMYSSEKVKAHHHHHRHHDGGNAKFTLFPSPFMVPSPRTPNINQII
jgi:hypothetical protein